MKTDFKTVVVGGAGLLGTITVEQANHWLAFAIGSLTILGLIPLVIIRWKKFLTNKTIPPFAE